MSKSALALPCVVVFSLLAAVLSTQAEDSKKDVEKIEEPKAEFETLGVKLRLRTNAKLRNAVENNNAPWEMFSNRLEEKIKGKDDDWNGITLVSNPMWADWNDPKYGKYKAWKLLSDRIPKYQSTYFATSDSLADGYYMLITNIDLPLPDKDDLRKAEAVRLKYLEATAQLNRAYARVGPNWQDFDQRQKALPEERRLSFDRWYALFDGATIGQLLDKLKPIAQEYSSWLGKAQKGYAFAANLLNEYENVAYQLPALSPDGLTLSYRTYNISPDLDKWIEVSKKAAKTGKSALEFSFNKFTKSTKTEETKLGAGGFLWTPFFSIGGNGGYEKLDIDTTTMDFNLSFKCAAIAQFTIEPGRWYNATAVKVFKDGPWIKDGPLDKKLVDMWGKKGLMRLKPAVLIVVYQPTISVKMSGTEFKLTREVYNAGGSLRIGPFGFGADYSKRKEDVSFDASNNTMTAGDSSEVPQILAVVNEIPNEK